MRESTFVCRRPGRRRGCRSRVPQEAAERCERESLCGRRIFANGFFFSTSRGDAREARTMVRRPRQLNCSFRRAPALHSGRPPRSNRITECKKYASPPTTAPAVPVVAPPAPPPRPSSSRLEPTPIVRTRTARWPERTRPRTRCYPRWRSSRCPRRTGSIGRRPGCPRR